MKRVKKVSIATVKVTHPIPSLSEPSFDISNEARILPGISSQESSHYASGKFDGERSSPRTVSVASSWESRVTMTGTCSPSQSLVSWNMEDHIGIRLIRSGIAAVTEMGLNSRESTLLSDDFFDKDGGSIRLEEKIKLRHLQQLMQQFMVHQPTLDPGEEAYQIRHHRKKERQPAGCMNLPEFKEAISRVLGTIEYNEYLEKLFTKLDTSCDGYVDWNEFCTYMLLLYRENDYLTTKREIPFIIEPKIRHIVYNRQEPTSRVVTVENPYRYVAISKEGVVTAWDSHLHFEKTFTIAEEEDESHMIKRRFKMWVTDAVYMANCHKLAVASTSRDIRFYDITSNQYFEEFHLFAMPDVPYCFDYWYDKKNSSGESMLVFGNDTGAIHVLYFTKPVSQLFEAPFQKDDGVKKIFFQELGQHSKWVHHVVCEDVHPEVIRQVKYLPENDAIISSSASPRSSLVISDMKGLKKSYIFRLEKGVESFDYSKSLSVLVTASADHLVRLWNPYVTSKPVAILNGHATGLIDVVIHEGLNQVFSYSKDAVIKVWDIKEHTCIQTVVLKFPSSIHGRMPEHGQFALHLQTQSPLNCLLVTCNDYLGQLKLGRTSLPKTYMPTTHDTQLCSAVYNPFFKQVVTGCDSSSIAVWELETGNKAIVFSNAHGQEEITCMTFDDSWRRLITGARNGTIKVWNFQNGHNLHKLEPVAEAEVTGIVALHDKKVVLAVGWSRLITQYDDSDPDNMYVKCNTFWKGGQVHQDDILTVDVCLPHLLATASFDGAIVVWNQENEKLVIQLRKGQVPKLSRKMAALQSNCELQPESTPSRPQSMNSRPNSRHINSHKLEKGQQAPVDKLLFLRARLNVRYTDGAVLVSSEGGILRFWSLYSQKHELGYFYAPDSSDESVLAMCTKPNNSVLITGDTQGNVRVWDIMTYCTKPEDRRVKSRPPLEGGWHAHDSAIVSVEYVEHDDGVFILTASTDRTARLWTMQGSYIGTFGQKKSWNLKDPTSWVHPQTPWTSLDNSQTNGSANEESDETASRKNSDAPENVELDIPTLERGDTLTSPLPSSRLLVPTSDMDNKVHVYSSPPAFGKTIRSQVATSVPDVLKLKSRSQTFAFGTGLEDSSKRSFLGMKVEKDLARKQKFRQCRRGQFGEISADQTARFGQICSPYQALTTPAIEEVKIPNNLPMSQRMINRGYTSANLTEDGLKVMDFSFLPDTPPSNDNDDTPQAPRKAMGSRGQWDDRTPRKLPAIRSARTGRSPRLPPHLTPLKKQPTVIL